MRRVYSILIYTLLLSYLTGCMTTSAIRKTGFTPDYNIEAVTGVGEVMYQEYNYLSQGWKQVRATKDFKWNLMTAEIYVPKGEVLTLVSPGVYCTNDRCHSALGFTNKVTFSDSNHDMIFENMQIVGTLGVYSSDLAYEPLSAHEEEAVLPGGFRNELVFQGLSKETIHILYREYQNDFARPAFFQDAQYDYKPGTIIRFMGVRIEIIKADQEQITYKIICGLSKNK